MKINNNSHTGENKMVEEKNVKTKKKSTKAEEDLMNENELEAMADALLENDEKPQKKKQCKLLLIKYYHMKIF